MGTSPSWAIALDFEANKGVARVLSAERVPCKSRVSSVLVDAVPKHISGLLNCDMVRVLRHSMSSTFLGFTRGCISYHDLDSHSVSTSSFCRLLKVRRAALAMRRLVRSFGRVRRNHKLSMSRDNA